MAGDDDSKNKEDREIKEFEQKYNVKIERRSFRSFYKSYFEFAAKSKPLVKKVIDSAKAYEEKAKKAIKVTKENIKKAIQAIKAGKGFTGKVYNIPYAQGLKKFSQKIGQEAKRQYESLKNALSTGFKGVKDAIVSYTAADIPSINLRRKPFKKNKNKDKNPSKNKKEGEEEERGDKIRPKEVAENISGAESNPQAARAVKEEAVLAQQREQSLHLGNALKVNQKQEENSRRQEDKRQDEARKRKETNKRNQESRRNERLAAEKEAREKLEKENQRVQDKEKKKIADIEARSNKIDNEIKELSTRHETNNARKEKIDALRVKMKERNKLSKQDENDQTMVLDWSQKNNKEVVKADGDVRRAQKEADKKVDDVKNKTEEVGKQVKSNADTARLSGQGQEIVNDKLNEIDAPSKGQNSDKAESKKKEKLSPEEIKMLREGVNPKDKAQVTRFEAEQNHVYSSENERSNTQQYQHSGRPQRSIGD